MQESFLTMRSASCLACFPRQLEPAGRSVIKNDAGAFPLMSSGIGFDAFTAFAAAASHCGLPLLFWTETDSN